MIARHVDLRRFCPNLLDVDSITRRARPNQFWLKRSAPVPTTRALLPVECQVPWYPQNTMLLVRCEMSTLGFSFELPESAIAVGSLSHSGDRPFTPD
jgi:hypothetical protein